MEPLAGFYRKKVALPDTFGRVFAAIDAEAFDEAFRRWVSGVVPALAKDEVVSIDGKTSRRSGKVGDTPLHRVRAFAAGAGMVLGQQATPRSRARKQPFPSCWPPWHWKAAS